MTKWKPISISIDGDYDMFHGCYLLPTFDKVGLLIRNEKKTRTIDVQLTTDEAEEYAKYILAGVKLQRRIQKRRNAIHNKRGE